MVQVQVSMPHTTRESMQSRWSLGMVTVESAIKPKRQDLKAFLKRNNHFLARKKTKVSELKQSMMNKEVEECKFKPQINRLPNVK